MISLVVIYDGQKYVSEPVKDEDAQGLWEKLDSTGVLERLSFLGAGGAKYFFPQQVLAHAIIVLESDTRQVNDG